MRYAASTSSDSAPRLIVLTPDDEPTDLDELAAIAQNRALDLCIYDETWLSQHWKGAFMPIIHERNQPNDARIDIFSCSYCLSIIETTPADIASMVLRHNSPSSDPREPESYWTIPCPVCGKDVQLLWSLQKIDPNKYRKLINAKRREQRQDERASFGNDPDFLRGASPEEQARTTRSSDVDGSLPLPIGTLHPGEQATIEITPSDDGMHAIAKLVDVRGVPASRPRSVFDEMNEHPELYGQHQDDDPARSLFGVPVEQSDFTLTGDEIKRGGAYGFARMPGDPLFELDGIMADDEQS